MRRVIPVVVLGFFLLASTPRAEAYGIETHALLTREAVTFFNERNAERGVRSELARYLLDGSRHEDSSPRWMNHFYDPVQNRGLTPDDRITPMARVGTWPSSKIWARSAEEQNKAKYKIPATIASILTAVEQRELSAISTETNFTWREAVAWYASGEEEKGLFMLGHILHLLQDASVPDHTRNDPHPGDSPYELFADRFTPTSPDMDMKNRLARKTPMRLGTLEEYFDTTAIYSNNNFYSKNTIGIQSGYSEPEPDFLEKEGDYFYGIKTIDGQGHRLFLKQKQGLWNTVSTNQRNVVLFLNKEGGDLVMSDYWSRLSVKAVESGAGAIELFFKEVEAAKGDPAMVRRVQPSLLAQTLEAISNSIDRIAAATREAVSTALGGGMGRKVIETISLAKAEEDAVTESLGSGATGSPPAPRLALLSAPESSAPRQELPQPELALSALEARQGEEIVLRGARFTPWGEVEVSVENPGGGRTMRRVSADGAGSFTETIRLARDEASGSYRILARDLGSGGEADARKLLILAAERPLERGEVVGEEVIAQTSAPEKTAAPNQTAQKAPEPAVCAFETTRRAAETGIRINELAWMGTKTSAADEWIELKNTAAAPRDIAGWQVVSEAGNVKAILKAASVIPAGGFYLLERTDDASAPDVRADLIYTGAMNNEKDGLRLFDASCAIVDEARATPSWSAGNSPERRTMERAESGIWQTSVLEGGTPKQENSKSNATGSGSGGGSSAGGGGATPAETTQQSTGNTAAAVQETRSSGAGSIDRAVLEITEIMYDLSGSDAGREWIELRNAGSEGVDLAKISFVEGGVRHTVTPVNGGGILPRGGYAIIVDSAEKFAADNPDYTGALLVSSFSLSNTGEALALHSGDRVIDTVTYTSTLGARGNGNSLQRMGSVWGSAPKTPGRENATAPTETGSETTDEASDTVTVEESGGGASAGSGVLVSEIFANPAGSDEGAEFVELYNATDAAVSLENWSVQYLPTGQEEGSAPRKKNFAPSAAIPARGFFSVGMNCSSATPCEGVDMSWSEALVNGGGTIYLVAKTEVVSGASDPAIRDTAVYAAPEGKSEERRAISGVACVSPQDEGEYLGNGCASGEAQFETRDLPRRQGTANLPEPRSAPEPLAASSWSAAYNPATISLDVSWTAVPDLTYRVANAAAPATALYEGSGTSFSWRLREVGREYTVAIRAVDRDGLASPAAEKSLAAPRLVSSIRWYRASHYTRENTVVEEPLVELSYAAYPFLPRDLVLGTPYGEPPAANYKAIVLYLNGEPPADEFLNRENPQQENAAQALSVLYKNCAGGTGAESALLLPDEASRCVGNVTEIGTGALNFGAYLADGDLSLLLPVARSDGSGSFAVTDYLTAAYYGYYREYPQGSSGSEITKVFRLLAVDATKVYFSTVAPEHLAPSAPQSVSLAYDVGTAKIVATWGAATDPDTADSLLRYEASYDGGTTWELAVSPSARAAQASTAYTVRLRARDDMNLLSPEASASITTPDPPADPAKNTLEKNPQPKGWLGQRLGTGLTGSLNSVTLRLMATEYSANPQLVILYSGSTSVATFARTFTQAEAGSVGEYTFTRDGGYALDAAADYTIVANLPDIGAVSYWGSDNPDQRPEGTAVRNWDSGWIEKTGPIKDLYLVLGFE